MRIITILMLLVIIVSVDAQEQEPLRCSPQQVRDIWGDWMAAAAQFDTVLQSEDVETIYFGMQTLNGTIGLVLDMCDPEQREWTGQGDKVLTGIDLHSGLWKITLEAEPLVSVHLQSAKTECPTAFMYVDEDAPSTEAVYRSSACTLVAQVDGAGEWVLRVEPL